MNEVYDEVVEQEAAEEVVVATDEEFQGVDAPETEGAQEGDAASEEAGADVEEVAAE